MAKDFPLSAQRKYMRIPFKEHGRGFDGCDCGGLVGLIYEQELGIKLPDWAAYYKTTRYESFGDLKHTIGGLLDQLFVEVPKGSAINPYDAVIFNIAGNPVHVGIAVNSCYFMHIMDGFTNVRQEQFSGLAWAKRLEGVFRYSPKAVQ